MTAHDELEPLLGALALGALEAAEARRVQRHATSCARCAAELASLRGVVDQLGSLSPAEALADPVLPSPGFTDRVVARVAADRLRESRRSRRWQVGLSAAAAVALLVGGVATATGLAREAPRGAPVEAVAVTSASGAGVDATAGVIAHTWGVEVVLTATGFDAGRSYSVEVLGRDGRVSSAGEFVGTGARRMVCRLNSSVLRADATAFVVRDDRGTERVRGSLLASGE